MGPGHLLTIQQLALTLFESVAWDALRAGSNGDEIKPWALADAGLRNPTDRAPVESRQRIRVDTTSLLLDEELIGLVVWLVLSYPRQIRVPARRASFWHLRQAPLSPSRTRPFDYQWTLCLHISMFTFPANM